MQSSPQRRVAGGARLVVLLALAVPLLTAHDPLPVLAYLAMILVWGLIFSMESVAGIDLTTTSLYEAFAVGAIGATFVGRVDAGLAMLALPPFLGGLYRPIRGVIQSALGVALGVGASLILLHPHVSHSEFKILIGWGVAGIGLGFVGSSMAKSFAVESDPLAAYRAASTLLGEVVGMSSDFRAGLDVHSISDQVLTDVTDHVDALEVALYAPEHGTMHCIGGTPFDESWGALAAEATSGPVTRQAGEFSALAFPLAASRPEAGVIVARVAAASPNALITKQLAGTLSRRAAQLEAALAFNRLIDFATTEERQRLSREIHDGLAQDIASLGYLVDAVAAGATEPRQQALVGTLRAKVSDIVAEVRGSLTTLRSGIADGESLGTALSGVVRRHSDSSSVPINVRLEEGTERLLPTVESELFRIGQEAIGNAVKHSQATAIDVSCVVRAPYARIVVSDNGAGLAQGRQDSYGLKIMNERARSIGAELSVTDSPGGGVTVTATIGADSAARRG